MEMEGGNLCQVHHTLSAWRNNGSTEFRENERHNDEEGLKWAALEIAYLQSFKERFVDSYG